MAEGGGAAPVPKPPVPVDHAKQLAELKHKLLLMKRSMVALRQELRNRTELWEAALDEIELLEGAANEAKATLKKQKEEMKIEKRKAVQNKSKDEGKLKGTGALDEPENEIAPADDDKKDGTDENKK